MPVSVSLLDMLDYDRVFVKSYKVIIGDTLKVMSARHLLLGLPCPVHCVFYACMESVFL